MRTTLTLDEDVAIELRRRCVSSGESFKRTVNRALRAGLQAFDEPSGSSRERYRTDPVSLGRSRLPNLDSIGEVLALIEGEDYQ